MTVEHSQRNSHLTERRKQSTRMEIARSALRLFADKGVERTTAGEIAAAAGVSLRTFWRYFPAKEEALRPLLAYGVEVLVDVVRHPSASEGFSTALIKGLGRESFMPLDELRSFVRLSLREPAVRAVWMAVHHETEGLLRDALLEDDESHDPARYLNAWMSAALINVTLRIALEAWAMCDDACLESTLGACLERAGQGVDTSTRAMTR